MSLTRPGVYITEQLSTSIQGSGASTAPMACFIGTSWKGTEEPTRVRSWSDYVRKFGGFPSSTQGASTQLPYSVHQFFANGGSECFVARVTDGSGVRAAATIMDSADEDPTGTLVVTAKSIGTWANDIYVRIVERDADEGRFDLFVLQGGETDTNIVERFVDLSMDVDDARYAVSVLNSDSRGSGLISVADGGSSTVAPGNAPAPASVKLGSGTDGGAAESDDFSDAIESLDSLTSPVIINLPGISDAVVINAAIQYAAGREDAFVVVDTSVEADSAEAESYASGLTATSYAAVYYPWITINDPSARRPGITRNVPPGGAVMGLIAATDRSRGPFQAPAGTSTRLTGAVGVSEDLTNTELGNLNVAGVNCLRPYPTGVAVMGARTLKRSGSDKYIPIRRTLIWLKHELTNITEFAIFRPNDEILWSSINNRVSQYLTDFWQSGGLRGATAEQAFFVKCDRDINTLADIENGVVNIEVGVALQHPAEFIIIKLGQWEGGSATTQEVTV